LQKEVVAHQKAVVHQNTKVEVEDHHQAEVQEDKARNNYRFKTCKTKSVACFFIV
jgi:hypothetical protein